MNSSVSLAQKRTRRRMAQLLRRFGGSSTGQMPSSEVTALRQLLTPHQQWVYQERIDLHPSIDVSTDRGQAQFLNWWLHFMPKEYAAAAESIDWGLMSSPYDPQGGAFSGLFTILMHKTYLLDEDLREEFRVETRHGRASFIVWYFSRGLFLEKVDESPYVDHILPQLSSPATPQESKLPINKFAALVLHRFRKHLKHLQLEDAPSVEEKFEGILNRHAPELLFLYRKLPDGVWPINPRLSLRSLAHVEPTKISAEETGGVNLVGYAHGAFGMGEHVRMVARALSLWSDKFSVIDVDAYAHQRQPEIDIEEWAKRDERHATNIFHVNADVMAAALTTLGPSIAVGRYNIGYWAWELSKVPDAWRKSIEFVDEIWAPSRFIQDAFQEVTDKPVVLMPLCVDLSFDTWKRRKHFGLPERKFLFLYYFDSYSYYQRKNPFAALRAFKTAFGDRQDVGLVVKTQNARADSPEWLELVDIAKGDARIHILNKAMTKGEVLSLQVECDCFVSLHRSEGFGRGPAEAMWLGKPVIVTGYSGNMDFTLPDNSLLVDYELIRVKVGEYPFFNNQVWAEPDVVHAARQMRRLVDEPGLATELGKRGSALLRSEYNLKSVGKRYADRLREIGAM